MTDATDATAADALAEVRSRNPFARVPEAERFRWLLWAALAVVITGAFMLVVGADLTEDGRASIVDLELAGDVDRAAQILDGWGVEGRQAALASLWADYPFLLAYAVALCLGALHVSARTAARGWTLVARLGLLLAWAALIAGVADALENGFLISEMASGPTVRQVSGARVAAITKFALAFSALGYVVLAGAATRLVPGGAAADDG